MDSEDDMHDANDVESVDDDFYSGETAMESDDGDAADYEFIDNDSDEDDDPVSHRSQNYTILNEADIHLRQEDNIKKISSILSISSDEAAILLRHYNWSVSKVNDEWFANEEKVRRIVGLLEESRALPRGKELTCGICFEVYTCDKMSSAACGHPFCVTCWQGYISTAINDGPGCLMLRCPDPSCGAAIGQDMIIKLVSHDDREKYERYFLRSFVEDNRKVTPTAHFQNDLGLDSLDTVEVVMALEEEFGFEIPDNEADKISSIELAVDFIASHPQAK